MAIPSSSEELGILAINVMKEIKCKNCGALYSGNDIPKSIKCFCNSNDFESLN